MSVDHSSAEHMLGLAGRRVVITGGCGGIGAATALRFATAGAHVAIADLDAQAADITAKHINSLDLPGRAVGFEVDVSNLKSVRELSERVIANLGGIEVWFNNAGVGSGGLLPDHEPDRDYHRVIRVNQDGVYHGLLVASRSFIDSRICGTIINTSSIYAESAFPGALAYGAAKAAVNAMTRSAALELAEYGIRVVGVAPGRVNTPIYRRFSSEQKEVFASEQLRRKMTAPEEIAEVVAFLASDAANAINGTTIHAEDGYLAFKNR